MADDTTDSDNLKDWAENNFQGVKNAIKKVQQEMRNSKPQENISVRKIDAEKLENHDTDQIVVEYRVQRWYSVNYFKKMLAEDEETDTGSEDDVLFGEDE